MFETEIKKINNFAEQLLAALKLGNERYIKRRLRQLIAFNGILEEKAKKKKNNDAVALTEKIGAEISKIQSNQDDFHECSKYAGVIVVLTTKENIYYQAFLEIMEKFRKHYSYLSIKKYSIDDLIKQFGPGIKNINDERNFVRTLVKILGLFEDGHIAVTDNKGNTHITYKKIIEKNFKSSLTYTKYFPEGLKIHNNAGAIGIYTDIIYVHFHSWSNHVTNEIKKLFSYFEFILINQPELNKLIIDVRSNTGGNDGFAQHFLSYLIPKGKYIEVSRNRYRTDQKDPTRFGPDMVNIAKSHNHLHFSGSVVGLIGNYCMSSNEFFVMGLESLKSHTKVGAVSKVTLVGDTTFGSSANPKEYSHPIGIKYLIPSWMCYTYYGKLLEGNGIKPDIHIKSSSTISRGKDKAFETAVKLLKS